MAEWLRSGLQNRLPRFNSGRGLQAFAAPQLRPGKPLIRGCRAVALAKAGVTGFIGASCFQSRRGFVIGNRAYAEWASSFPGSSAVEQPAVNRLVAGSNPARGATPSQIQGIGLGAHERRGPVCWANINRNPQPVGICPDPQASAPLPPAYTTPTPVPDPGTASYPTPARGLRLPRVDRSSARIAFRLRI